MTPVRLSRLAAGLVLIALASGCSNSNGPNGGGGGSLGTTNATPASGNATFDNLTIAHDTGAEAITGGIAIRATQTIGAFDHEISIYFDSTGVITTAQHQWITGSPAALVGLAQCSSAGTACDPAKISVDLVAKEITFTALVLPDPIGGSTTSTVDGMITYP